MSLLPLYLIESVGLPRNHHALFVQLNTEHGNGRLFQVTGNIQEGMTFETRLEPRPELSAEFLGKTPMGWVWDTELDQMEQICRSNPAPAKQFEGAKRLARDEPLRRCQEWTRETLGLLEDESIVKKQAKC